MRVVGGSNPLAPTISSIHIFRYFVYFSDQLSDAARPGEVGVDVGSGAGHLACGAFERHSSTGSYDCHSAGLVNKSLRDPIATAKSPVLSQNDSSEPLVVTPNNQENSRSYGVDRFLLKKVGRGIIQPSTIYSQHGLKQSDWRESHVQDHKGTVRPQETKEVWLWIMGHLLCLALRGFTENSKTDLVVLFG